MRAGVRGPKAKRAGKTTVRLRFTSRGRRSVRRAHRLRLSLKVSFARSGQATLSRTVKATVKH